uniref:GG23746 n=1 Tax=Drosophila erecta TaxID=7220 RepID=B3NZ10_DROER
MELELRSRQYYSSTPKIGGRKMIIENQHYGENKDTEKELSALQYSSILPSQSKTETEILKPASISVPLVPFSANFDECPNWNSECKSNGGNRSQDTILPDLPYSTDPMESNALVYSSSESLDIMCVVDNNPENHQLAGRGNADKDSPDKEFFVFCILLVKHVLDLFLVTVSFQGAVNQYLNIGLEFGNVGDLSKFQTTLDTLFNHLRLCHFRVSILALFDVSNKFYLSFLSALVSWPAFIA